MPKKVERDKSKEKGYGAAFVVTGPVRLDQLSYEVAEAMGWDKPAAISVEGRVEDASEENPVVVHLESQGITAEQFTEVVEAHEPDPGWGAPQEEGLEDYPAIKQKALDGEVLTDDEVRIAMTGLLRETNRRNL